MLENMDIFNSRGGDITLTSSWHFCPVSWAFLSGFSHFYRSPKQKQEEVAGKLKGSMTVEAALILPIFLFAMLSISFMIEVVRLQIHIGCAAGQVSKELAGYGYTYLKIKDKLSDGNQQIQDKETEERWKIKNELISIPSLFLAQSKIKEFAGEDYLNKSIIINGANGLSLIGSEILEDGKWINLRVSYEVQLPFNIIPNFKVKVTQHASSHAWIGNVETDDSSEDSDIVYMTEYGKKYHLSKNCKYLNIKVHAVSEGEIDKCRNKNGGKYYPCHRCMGESDGCYFITDYGTSYHTKRNCTAISRNIIEKKLSDVQGVSDCCKECGK